MESNSEAQVMHKNLDGGILVAVEAKGYLKRKISQQRLLTRVEDYNHFVARVQSS